jgi:hypothetical protein
MPIRRADTEQPIASLADLGWLDLGDETLEERLVRLVCHFAGLDPGTGSRIDGAVIRSSPAYFTVCANTREVLPDRSD